MPETELERVPHDGLLDLLAMCREEVPNRGANEVGAVGVEAFLNQQIDVTKVHVAEVDRDLLAVGRSFAKTLNLGSHCRLSIHVDGIWMMEGWIFKRPRTPFRATQTEFGTGGKRPEGIAPSRTGLAGSIDRSTSCRRA